MNGIEVTSDGLCVNTEGLYLTNVTIEEMPDDIFATYKNYSSNICDAMFVKSVCGMDNVLI